MFSKQLPMASLLHNKPESPGILPGNFCAQGQDKRYTLYDVNLLPLLSFCCLLRASSSNGALSKLSCLTIAT